MSFEIAEDEEIIDAVWGRAPQSDRGIGQEFKTDGIQRADPVCCDLLIDMMETALPGRGVSHGDDSTRLE